MDRRSFISTCAAGALGIPLCGRLLEALPARAGETGTTPHWSYSGADGPEHWGSLSTDFATCSVGIQQSPINLSDADAIAANIGHIQIAYKPIPLRIVNNGHTIQVNCAPGSHVTLRSQTYNLLQFHFHAPSEHTHNGDRYAMELHFVHQNAAERIAVLGVFLGEGPPNTSLDPIWNNMPAIAGPERAVPDVRVDPTTLVPASAEYFAYLGSLTTPPCTEGVRWVVLARPASVSRGQVRKFQSIIAKNARPLQNLNQRFVLQQL